MLDNDSVLFSGNSPFNMSELFQRWVLPYQPFGAGDPDPHTGQDAPRRGGRRGRQGGQGGLQVLHGVHDLQMWPLQRSRCPKWPSDRNGGPGSRSYKTDVDMSSEMAKVAKFCQQIYTAGPGAKAHIGRWPKRYGRYHGQNGQRGLQIGTAGQGCEGYSAEGGHGDVAAEIVKLAFR